MKRSVLLALGISLALTAMVAVLHLAGLLIGVEAAVLGLLSHQQLWARSMGAVAQFGIVFLLGLTICWLTLTSTRRSRIGILAAILVVELAALCWILSLYRFAFQPLPAMIVVALSYVIAERWAVLSTRNRSTLVRSFFGDRLSKGQLNRMIEGEIPIETEAKAHEVTVVVCDIANKYDLAEEVDPTEFTRTTEAFIRRTSDLFLEEGGYIQAADGEGVVAIFGFPGASGDHADKAVRMTLGLIDSFNKNRTQNNGDPFGKCDVHMGVS